MKKAFYTIFSILAFLSSCSSDSNEILVPKLLIKETVKFNNGTVYQSTVFNYEGNKLVQLIFKDKNANIILTGAIEYNEQLPIRINEYNASNDLIQYVLIEYSNTNQLTKYIEYNTVDNTAKKYMMSYGANTISKDIYSGDFTTQNTFIGYKNYELDNNENIIKVVSNNYTVKYTYDNMNGVFKNITSKNILNILGRLHNPLDFGTNNNSSSYEYTNGNITDHINLNYTYDNENFPINLLEVSPKFGDSNLTEYEYQ